MENLQGSDIREINIHPLKEDKTTLNQKNN